MKSDSSTVRTNIFYIHFLFRGVFKCLTPKYGMLNRVCLF